MTVNPESAEQSLKQEKGVGPTGKVEVKPEEGAQQSIHKTRWKHGLLQEAPQFSYCFTEEEKVRSTKDDGTKSEKNIKWPTSK